jgi:hypothetical protein
LLLAAVHHLLQLQEKILEWFKNGSWQEIVSEKRSVLTSMQQVLQSCYALLDSTQVPVNSIIKLLQHILRCGWGVSCCVQEICPISRAVDAVVCMQQWQCEQ